MGSLGSISGLDTSVRKVYGPHLQDGSTFAYGLSNLLITLLLGRTDTL